LSSWFTYIHGIKIIMQLHRPTTWQLVAILAIAIVAVSTSAIWVRLATAAVGAPSVGFSLVLAATRMGVAALVLLPAWRGVVNHPPSRGAIAYAIMAGVALAIHFAVWITSLGYTSIAASTALVTTNPVWVALLSWLWFKEKPSQQTLLGTGIALCGGLLIGMGSPAHAANTGSNPLLGNGLALMGAWTESIYLLCGREAQRQGLSIGSYAAIAYSVAAILLFPLPHWAGASYGGYSWTVYGCILLTALVPQLIGHTSFNWVVRWMSPTWVTLILLLEPVLSSIFGYWVFKEVPTGPVLVGAFVLLGGVAIAVVQKK
jgi:drug/metabolite transporter (DMT)-like permease